MTSLTVSLLSLRLGVFIVMFMWTLDKFLNPGHTSKIFTNFYGLGGLDSTVFTVLAILQMIIVLAFVAGVLRRVSYGLVLVMHAVSTLSSWRQYLAPFDHLLFFAAWPMLAACLALYLLREEDALLNFDGWRARNAE
ncbi:hypothetical protein [Alcanivorax sp. 24]|uniref:hypothetical protein n=1 Tax=Alcanivorax sp. 24 TaxID=2545266 RepID=UPI0010602B21|nr:hypothetical protein [Alcanivorax sp. 24]